MWKRVVDGVRGRVARFRAPGAASSQAIPQDLDESRPVDRPVPVAASILWQPIHTGASGTASSFIYITQRALAAVEEHCAAERTACSGLLTGELYQSPDTEEPYVVVESTIRLPTSPGDNAKTSLVQGWVVAQSVLRATGEQLVGWYRGEGGTEEHVAAEGVGTGESGPTEVKLSIAEAEAHTALFPQPWQIALKVGPGRGGVFSPAAGGAWAHRCISFHEIVDPSAVGPDGSARTTLHWDNYRSDQAVIRTDPAPAGATLVVPEHPAPLVGGVGAAEPPIPARRPQRQSPRVLLPDQFGESIGVDRHKSSPTSWGKRAAVVGAYGVVGLLAITGLFRLYSALASPSSPGSRPAPAEDPVVTPEARLDRAADTLGLAIAAFDLRARMFASRQMQCPELARGLVLVEERWSAYNAARKDAGASLDSARTARDRNLYADADGVERRFERSRCPRP
ncbi:MAG TPA: hypothetical protein VNH14_04675 [Gemmatimonadales bacterium]|nr:hypothetical protein [Gemmatimonadales bacterium]